METNELLKAISDMMDQKLEPIKSDLQSLKDEQAAMKSDLHSLKDEQAAMKSDLQSLKDEQATMKSDLQMQIKRTERNLKAEIIESENMILDEVSRVHHILNDHIADKDIHTA